MAIGEVVVCVYGCLGWVGGVAETGTLPCFCGFGLRVVFLPLPKFCESFVRSIRQDSLDPWKV